MLFNGIIVRNPLASVMFVSNISLINIGAIRFSYKIIKNISNVITR